MPADRVVSVSGTERGHDTRPGERDPHATITPTEARERGCTCEFGCRACGNPLARMFACPSWTPCYVDAMKIGRAPDPHCPLEAA